MAWWSRKPAPIGGSPSSGGKSGRVNEWPKCRACWHRVPPGAIHSRGNCQRATNEGNEGLPPTHRQPCCPGWCRVCGICWDRDHIECKQCSRCILECPGPCNDCGECLDRCPGHAKGEHK